MSIWDTLKVPLEGTKISISYTIKILKNRKLSRKNICILAFNFFCFYFTAIYRRSRRSIRDATWPDLLPVSLGLLPSHPTQKHTESVAWLFHENVDLPFSSGRSNFKITETFRFNLKKIFKIRFLRHVFWCVFKILILAYFCCVIKNTHKK